MLIRPSSAVKLAGIPTASARPSMRASSAAAPSSRRPPSLYDVLQVGSKASRGEIKAAYRALAKRLHPDVSGGGAAAEFIEIHRAYAMLSDPEARASYDLSIGRMRVGLGLGLGFVGVARPRGRRWETDQCW